MKTTTGNQVYSEKPMPLTKLRKTEHTKGNCHCVLKASCVTDKYRGYLILSALVYC